MSRKYMIYFDKPNKTILIAKWRGDVNQGIKVCHSSISETKKPKLLHLRGFFCWTRIIKSIFWLMVTWLKLKCHQKYLNSHSESYFNLWHRHTPHDRPSVNVVSASSIRLLMIIPHWLAHRQLHPKEWSHIKISLSVNRRIWHETWNKAKNLQAVTEIVQKNSANKNQIGQCERGPFIRLPNSGSGDVGQSPVPATSSLPDLEHIALEHFFLDEFEKIRDHKWCTVWPRQWFRKCLN